MIEIHTLGRTRVAVNGQPLTGEAAWPRSLALIIYMAREPGPDRRQEILGVLWPDREERRARRALNQLIYTLRKASPELDLESVSDALDFGKEVWLDVEEFERRLEGGDLEGAVKLYEGPFLADLTLDEPEFDHWADRQRAEARRKFRKAALQLATAAGESGDHESAVAHCRRLVQSDPLDDEAQHLLIDCLHRRGDRTSALRQFERYREALARELQVEPLDHTLELIARIRGEAQAGEPERPSVGQEGGAVQGARRAETDKETPEPASEGGREQEGASEPVRSRPARPPSAEGAAEPRGALGVLLRSQVTSGLVGLVIGAGLAIWAWPAISGAGAGQVGAAAGSGGLAVLPFQLHGISAESDEGFSTGIAQLLTLELAESGNGRTIPYRTVLRIWEARKPQPGATVDPTMLRELSAALGAERFVVGDAHAAGGQLRLVAELINADTGEPIARADVKGSRDDYFDLIQRCAASLSVPGDR